jgi:AcrR family transcriptional regulator
MPKIVDHDERRAEVLDATWRVISERGLEAATVREIAREAGVSNGVLAHYFTSKDDILVQAHRLAYDRVFKRVERLTTHLTSLDTLRAMMDEALPLDEERRVEALIDVSYMSRALTNPVLTEVRGQSAEVARQWWHDAITAAKDAGALRDDLNVDLVVQEILVFIDGVSIQAVLYPNAMTPELQRQLADAFLARLVA